MNDTGKIILKAINIEDQSTKIIAATRKFEPLTLIAEENKEEEEEKSFETINGDGQKINLRPAACSDIMVEDIGSSSLR